MTEGDCVVWPVGLVRVTDCVIETDIVRRPVTIVRVTDSVLVTEGDRDGDTDALSVLGPRKTQHLPKGKVITIYTKISCCFSPFYVNTTG